MNKIIISDIVIFGYHGVYHEEKKEGQNFSISMHYSIELNNNKNILDYSIIIKKITELFNLERFDYLEDLGNYIFNLLLDEFSFVYLKLIISKIDKPKIKISDGINIESQKISIQIES